MIKKAPSDPSIPSVELMTCSFKGRLSVEMTTKWIPHRVRNDRVLLFCNVVAGVG